MVVPHLKNLTAASIGIALLALSGCSRSPNFEHEPPATYRIPFPQELNGVWAREGKDNGERVRVSSLDDGTMRIDFFKTSPSAKPAPDQPLIAQTLRFDGKDWLLIDMRKVSSLEGSQYAGQAPYKLIRYVLEDADRLCGIEPSATQFAGAIKSGKLDGNVKTYVEPLTFVTVTSSGEEWVKWWSGLPDSEKLFVQPVYCFQRVN
jgi:hypothetical protein